MANIYTQLKYHVFFSALDAQPWIKPDLQARLGDYIGGILQRRDTRLITCGGTSDHVHLLFGMQPTRSVADTIAAVKASTSRWLKGHTSPFSWQRGYAAFSVSESEVPAVERYIREQGHRHSTMSFAEELQRFLDIHGLERRGTSELHPQYTFHRLRYHLVFSTKNRLWLIPSEASARLHSTIEEVIGREGGEPIETGGMPDHVHVFLFMKPDQTITRMIKMIKGTSSRWMSETLGPQSPFAWQDGYGAFTVSESQAAVVQQYIQRQEEHHRTVSFREELRQLLPPDGLRVLSSPKGVSR
jgi:REP element-mobilizing transposase RayT